MRVGNKVAYASGNFANTLCQQAVGLLVQFYYIDELGLSPVFAGAAWIAYSVWNAVNDPLAGNLSDRTSGRLGRRKPYILLGSIPLGGAFALLWIPPTGGGAATALWFLLTLFLFDAVYSLVTVPYNAYYAELATGARERGSLAAWREAFGGVALLFAFVAAPVLADELGYALMGLVLGALTAVCYLLAFFSGPTVRHEPVVVPGLSRSVRMCLEQHAFRVFAVASVLTWLIWAIMPATLPFYIKYVLRSQEGAVLFGLPIEPGLTEAVLLGTPFVLVVPLMAAWNVIVRRIGARRAYSLAFALFVPGVVVLLLAPGFQLAFLGTTLLAPGLAGMQVSRLCLLGEIIDHDVARTGIVRSGAYFGINGLLSKVAFAVQGLLVALVLPLSGYLPNAVQPTGALAGMRFLFAGVPLIACMAGVLALRAYRLDPAMKVA